MTRRNPPWLVFNTNKPWRTPRHRSVTTPTIRPPIFQRRGLNSAMSEIVAAEAQLRMDVDHARNYLKLQRQKLRNERTAGQAYERQRKVFAAERRLRGLYKYKRELDEIKDEKFDEAVGAWIDAHPDEAPPVYSDTNL